MRSPAKSQQPPSRSSPVSSAASSRALEWLWQYLGDVRHPRILDCGPVSQARLSVFLKRGAKVYVADLLTPLLRGEPAFWTRNNKVIIFRLDEFLQQLPTIAPESLDTIFSWQLFDLLPRDALGGLVKRFWSYLKPRGMLFCLLREPYLPAGVETSWSFESLTVLTAGAESRQPFTYPALTNREVEKLLPGGNVKTFLTRGARREVLGIK